jgi:hypothetical protein
VKIGLISDTHIPSSGKEPPAEVVTAFEGVERSPERAQAAF